MRARITGPPLCLDTPDAYCTRDTFRTNEQHQTRFGSRLSYRCARRSLGTLTRGKNSVVRGNFASTRARHANPKTGRASKRLSLNKSCLSFHVSDNRKSGFDNADDKCLDEWSISTCVSLLPLARRDPGRRDISEILDVARRD